MAETQTPTDGYMGQFWLHNGSELYKARHVKSFTLPSGGQREQIDVTTLESPGRRREYISGFYEDTDFEVVLNSRPASDTDILLQDALDEADVRAFKMVIPEDGELVSQIEGTAKCIGYSRGTVGEGPMEATATFRVVTVDAIEPYAS